MLLRTAPCCTYVAQLLKTGQTNHSIFAAQTLHTVLDWLGSSPAAGQVVGKQEWSCRYTQYWETLYWEILYHTNGAPSEGIPQRANGARIKVPPAWMCWRWKSRIRCWICCLSSSSEGKCCVTSRWDTPAQSMDTCPSLNPMTSNVVAWGNAYIGNAHVSHPAGYREREL